MSQNEDPSTGGVYTSENIQLEDSSNVKMVTVDTSTPSTTYDGQHWIDTTENPPEVNIRDETNTQWMTREITDYESIAQTIPTVTPRKNGMLVVVYNTDTTVTTLLAFSGNTWVGVDDQ